MARLKREMPYYGRLQKKGSSQWNHTTTFQYIKQEQLSQLEDYGCQQCHQDDFPFVGGSVAKKTDSGPSQGERVDQG